MSTLYLLLQTLLSANLSAPTLEMRTTSFDIVVPAHNEAGNIAHTFGSLRAVIWPADLFRVIVIADNCTDDTALVARSAGATVIERQDLVRRGKGYALEFAFQYCSAPQPRTAIVGSAGRRDAFS